MPTEDETIPNFPMERTYHFAPPPAMLDIQARCPVSRVRIWDGSTPWVITRHEHVRQMSADPRLSVEPSSPSFPHWNAQSAAMKSYTTAFLNMDDPIHAVHRKAVAPHFTLRKMEQLRPMIRGIVDERIDLMLAGPKPVDLIEAVAFPIPSTVVCHLLGVPYADHDFFQGVVQTVLSRTAEPSEVVDASRRLHEYFEHLVDTINERPDDESTQGLLQALVVEQLLPGLLSRADVVGIASLLLIAGHQTTAATMALGAVALLEHPEQRRVLQTNVEPGLLANAVEEILRYATVTQGGRRRVALADVELDGQLIAAGDGLIIANDVANRDPAVFIDPNKFDIERPARKQITFGHGIHQCVGQQLARIELQEFFSRVFRRVPTLELAVPLDNLRFKHGGIVYDLEELPVTW